MRVAVGSGRVPERVGLRCVEAVAAADTAAEDADRDGEAGHGALDDLADALGAADVSVRLEDRLAAVDVAEFVGRAKRRTERERRRFAKVGGTVAAGTSVRDARLGALLAGCADEGICPP